MRSAMNKLFNKHLFCYWRMRQQKQICRERADWPLLAAMLMLPSQFLLTACVELARTRPQNAGIYVLHRNGITKLDAHSHKVLWQAWPEEAKQEESAAFHLKERLASDGERLYVSGFLISSRSKPPEKHMVYAYSVDDGRQVWSQSFPAYHYVDKFPSGSAAHYSLGSLTSPVVSQGHVYVASDVGQVYALDAQSGKLLWTYEVKVEGIRCPGQKDTPFCLDWIRSKAVARPIVAQGLLYNAIKDWVYALNPTDGKLYWSVSLPAGQQVTDQLAFANGRLYVTACALKQDAQGIDSACYISAYQAASGQKLWQTSEPRYRLSNTIVQNGTVYAISDAENMEEVTPDAGIYSWDAATGKSGWSYTTKKLPMVYPPLLGAQNTVIVSFLGTRAQGLMLITMALNAKSGNVCWESKPEVLVQVAVQGSTLYLGAYARLVAYDITDGRKQWELMVPELKRGQTFVSDVLELH